MKPNYFSANRPGRLCLLVVLSTAAATMAQEGRNPLMVLREIEGAPSSVAVHAGKQKYARSERKSRGSRLARVDVHHRHRQSVKSDYGAVLVSWHASDGARAGARKAARLRREAAERAAAAAARAVKAAEAQVVAARNARAKQAAARLAQIKRAEDEKAAQRLKEARDAEQRQEEAEKLAAALREGVRQNLTFAFVDPHQKPVGGVQLTASVQTPDGGEKTLTDLKTDEAGHLRLANLQLPATVDFEVVGTDGKPGEEKDAASTEWDFADVKDSTLMVANPLGTARTAWNTGAATHPRLASLRLSRAMLPEGKPARLAAANRVKIYEGTLAPIVLERTVVDVKVSAPAGSTLTTPALEDKSFVVPEAGEVTLRLPRAALEEGALPIRAAKSLPGGESEAVISDYGTDAYRVNAVAAPPLELVKVSDVKMPAGPEVLGTRADVVAALGDLKAKSNKKNELGKVVAVADGSEWWSYPGKGMAFKMRPVVDAKPKDKNAPMMVERVRLFTADGGSLGGVHAGSTVEEMRAQLGVPQEENVAKTPSDAADAAGQIDSWLDGGLRICHDATKVLWVETARTRPLLSEGTTAFVQHPRARLFIESFHGASRTNLESLNNLKAYLQQVQSVTIVNNREDADLVLSASVGFEQDWDKVASAFPYRYDCSTTITYTLSQVEDNGSLRVIDRKDKVVVGRAKVDFTKELLILGGLSAALHKQGTLALLLGGFGLAEVHDAVRKAANRCPAVSSRNAFGEMVHDIDKASDFTTRVSQIDYSAGRLRLNAGSKAGLFVSTPERSCEFLLSVGGAELPAFESDKDSDYYVARVLQVEDNSSICELRHLHRHVGRNCKESFKDEPAPDVLRRLPDAVTGAIGARAAVQFPPVNIFTEAEAAAAAKREQEDSDKQTGGAQTGGI